MHEPEQVIRDAVRQFLVAQFVTGVHDGALDDGANFIEAGLVDSFGLIEIIAFVERTFSVRLSDEELISPSVTSVRGLAALVKAHHR
jgi:acyl carrier protein